MVVGRHRGSKAIALTTLRLEALWRLRPLLNGSAYRQNVALHGGVVDIGVRPHLIEKFFFRDDAIAMLDEVQEDRIRLRRERNGMSSPTHLPRLGIKFVVVEYIAHPTSSGAWIKRSVSASPHLPCTRFPLPYARRGAQFRDRSKALRFFSLLPCALS